MFVKFCLVLAFANVWPVLICLKRLRIMECCCIMMWKILNPQRIDNICKDEYVGSEDNKSHFISFTKCCVQR